jgi:hypothetical protein
VAISYFKKKEAKPIILKNRLPRLNASGVQARNDKKDESRFAPRYGSKSALNRLKI